LRIVCLVTRGVTSKGRTLFAAAIRRRFGLADSFRSSRLVVRPGANFGPWLFLFTRLANVLSDRLAMLLSGGLAMLVPAWRARHNYGGVAAEIAPQFLGVVVVNRAGMCQGFGDAELVQFIDDLTRLNFELPRQLIDSDLTHV